MSDSYQERLGTTPIPKLIFQMALPAIAAQLINLLYSIVDRIYIGHIPDIGTDALAGVGITSSLLMLISALTSIVASGAAPLCAIALGQGNQERAKRILGNGFLLLLIFATFSMILIYSFMEPVLVLIGASSGTLGYATDYLRIYLLGTFFVMTSVGLNTFISSQGRPGIAMCSVVIGAVVNIILDYVFILIFSMGVKGAAIATVIAQLCSAIWVLGFLFSKKAGLRLSFHYMRPDRHIIGSIFALGVSPFIMGITESDIGFVLNGSLSAYGDIYVSTLTVMQSAMQFVSVPLSGFTQGATPVMSYNYGHRNPDRVRQTFRVIFCVMTFFNLAAILSMIIFPGFVAGIFTDDPLLIEKVTHIMPVFLAGMTIFGLQRTCQTCFIALGQAKISLFIALLRKVILLIPLSLILPHFMGVMGVYAGEAIADGTAAILCTLLFAFRFPKIVRSISKPNS